MSQEYIEIRGARIIGAMNPDLLTLAERTVPPNYAASVGENLALHGITFELLTVTREAVAVQAFRATRIEFSSTPFEGRQRAKFEGQWSEEVRSFAAGTLFVRMAQPLARLVLALRTAGAGLAGRVGFLQCLFRAEGTNGALRGGADCTRDAGCGRYPASSLRTQDR